MPQQNLFATLIGINAYPKNPLNGCVQDALEMDTFLRKLCLQQSGGALTYAPSYFLAPHLEDTRLRGHAETHAGFDPSAVRLPTFQNLTTEAFAHLKQARDGDICLFYYSGHGSTMTAPEEFRGSKSKLQNETIVCVDSRTGARDLIDKEIAFLLWDALQGKNVHCIVIMDCCFAGNNTRAAEVDSLIGYRHTSDSKQQISLQQYLGYDQGFYSPKPGGGVEIKIAKYVQLAASMDNQTAQETSSEGGLFTSKLLEVLKKGGSARSYRDLMQTTRLSVRNRNPNQHPVEFAAEDKDLDQPFLGGEIVPYKPTFEVYFDAAAQKWRLEGGAMDGLVSSPQNPTRVKIEGTDKEFNIEEVFSNFSYLEARLEDLNTEQVDSYQAIITKYATPLLQVCVSNGILEDAERMQALKTAYGDGSGFPYLSLYFEKEKQDAAYQIRLSEDGTYVLVRTGSTIPLFKREREPKSFLTNVDYVGKWLVAGELKNTDTHFKKEDFIFKLERIEGLDYDANNIETLPSTQINEDMYLPEIAEFKYINGYQPAFRLSIQINPNSNLESCYMGALYLQSDYKILTDLIRADENHLVKGGAPIRLKFFDQKKTKRLYSTLPLSVHPDYSHYNINEVAAYLKIVVSEQPFSLNIYAQDELKLDNQPNLKTREIGFSRAKDDTPEQSDWCVFTTRVLTVGPKKGHPLQNAGSVDFSGFRIEAPEGFQALAFAGTGDDVAKKLAEAKRSKSAESTHAIAPPSGLFGDANTLDQAFPAGISGAANNSVQVLELRAVPGGAELALPPGKEIKITPKSALGKAETIVPFGYDEESGLYFPVGYTDHTGVVHIEHLPPPNEGIIEDLSRGDEKVRSLGGSVKLFFQKVAWSRLTGVKEYDRLSLHRRASDGSIAEIAYLGSERSQDKADQIAQAIGGGEALLLVHGIIGDTKGMVEAVLGSEALHGTFAGVLSFDYENLTSGIEVSAQKLKDMLLACGFGEGKRLTIVAHSMGGLVSRYLIEHLGGDRFVKKLIQCGTPNGGSELADFRRKVTGWLCAGLNGVSIFQPYMAAAAFLGKRLEKGLFHTLDQMDPDSLFIAQLNAPGKARPEVPYYLVGGDTSQIAVAHPEDASLLEKIFKTLKERALYTGLDLAVFDKVPNDMAVKVERMKHLPWGGHDGTAILDCDHVSYFADEESLGKIGGWIGGV